MRILYFGDVVGKVGRTLVLERLSDLRKKHRADFVVVNGENSAHGFGITGKICDAFLSAGADVVITGNHVWDQRDTLDYIVKQPRLLRPANFPPESPGRGHGVFPLPDGRKVLVVQLQGRLFMTPLDDPFRVVDAILAEHPLGQAVDAVFVDIHAEATSEKLGLAHFLDGRVSMVIGSHTHIPTADAQVLPGGTAYQTDIGMCGDYDSVIGMNKDIAVSRLVGVLPADRLEPAGGGATLCAAVVETDDETGLATSIFPVRLGGRLIPAPN